MSDPERSKQHTVEHLWNACNESEKHSMAHHISKLYTSFISTTKAQTMENTLRPMTRSEERRKEVLSAAEAAVMKDRNAAYGDPEDNFRDIAELWSAYLKVLVSPTDTAAMMILMKCARVRTNPQHTDSWVDIAGYAACGNSAKMEPKISASSRTLEASIQAVRAQQNSNILSGLKREVDRDFAAGESAERSRDNITR